jgi:hypothetical protein
MITAYATNTNPIRLTIDFPKSAPPGTAAHPSRVIVGWLVARQPVIVLTALTGLLAVVPAGVALAVTQLAGFLA